MGKNHIIASVRQYIFSQFPTARQRSLGDTDPLLESGIIDSLGVLDVVGFIEAEFKIAVDDEDLTPENFQNICQISAFVERKMLAAA